MTPVPQETPDPMPSEPDSEFIDGRHRVCLSDYYELQRYIERQSERLRATEARLEATERERKRAIDMAHKAEAALARFEGKVAVPVVPTIATCIPDKPSGISLDEAGLGGTDANASPMLRYNKIYLTPENREDAIKELWAWDREFDSARELLARLVIILSRQDF